MKRIFKYRCRRDPGKLSNNSCYTYSTPLRFVPGCWGKVPNLELSTQSSRDFFGEKVNRTSPRVVGTDIWLRIAHEEERGTPLRKSAKNVLVHILSDHKIYDYQYSSLQYLVGTYLIYSSPLHKCFV